jgi:hypothetical protein
MELAIQTQSSRMAAYWRPRGGTESLGSEAGEGFVSVVISAISVIRNTGLRTSHKLPPPFLQEICSKTGPQIIRLPSWTFQSILTAVLGDTLFDGIFADTF